MATLHGFPPSTPAWRVRIALRPKGIADTDSFHHLRRGEQRSPAYLALNPQRLLPACELDDGRVLNQRHVVQVSPIIAYALASRIGVA